MIQRITDRQLSRITIGLNLICLLACVEAAPLGTAFTYQGRLTQDGQPATNLYEMQFALFDSGTNGNQLGLPVSRAPVAVTNGLFTVELDFGAAAFDGSPRWLEITLSLYSSNAPPVTLSPRQPITSVPYANYARAAGQAAVVTGSVPAIQITGTIAPANIAPGTITQSMLAHGAVGSDQLAGDIQVSNFNHIVYIPQAGHITNIFKTLSNDTAYVLAPGTHNITTFQGETSTLHLQMVNKTNITIRGLGNSVLYSSNNGGFFLLRDCSNIVFEDFVVRGTRIPFTDAPLFGAFMLEGTNSFITWRRLHLKDHQDHGIVCLSSENNPIKNSVHCTVEHCLFESIGQTNDIPSSNTGDGVAVNAIGSHMKIINNRFLRCGFGVEIEGPATNRIVDLLIQGNSFIDGLKSAIVNFPTSPRATYTDVLIADNYFKFDIHAASSAIGISMANVTRGKIMNNTFVSNSTAIFFLGLAAADSMYGWEISNNQIIDCGAQGMKLLCVGCTLDSFLVSGNYFTNTFYDPIYGDSIIRSMFVNNIAHRSALAGEGEAALIRFTEGYGDSSDNTISGNSVISVGSSSPLVILALGVTGTRIIGNHFRHVPTNAWTDNGAGNEFRNNWIGTNLAVRSTIYEGPTAVQSLAANAAVSLDALVIQVAGNGTPITLSTNTSVPNGLWDGQPLRIIGTSTNTVTFPDNSNVQLGGGTSKTLGNRDILDLIWNANRADWLQTGFSDN